MVQIQGVAATRDDVLGTVGALGPWWQQLTDGRGEDLVAAHGWAMVAALRASLGAPPEPEPRDLPGATVDELGAACRRRLAAQPWDDPTRAETAALLDATLGALRAAAADLRAAGRLPATAVGRVGALHLSDGGVPKQPVDEVTVDQGGVVGDRQATRRHHGRPWQALCLWSAEVIAELAAQGHPIAPGAAGENVTVEGLDWADVRAGTQLQLGEVRAEVSVFALPCAANAQWFRDGDVLHMHHDRGPVSRVYASVLRPGTVRVGDPVVLEPGG